MSACRVPKAIPGTKRHALALVQRGAAEAVRRRGGLGNLGDILSDAEAVCASIGYPCDCNWHKLDNPGTFLPGTVIPDMPWCSVAGYTGLFDANLIARPGGGTTLKNDLDYQKAQQQIIATMPYVAPVATPPTSSYYKPPATTPTYSSPPAYTAPAPAPAAPAHTPVVTGSTPAPAHSQAPATIPAAAQSVIYQAASGQGVQQVGGGVQLARSTTSSGAGTGAAAASPSSLDQLWQKAAENKTALALVAVAAAAYFFGSTKRGR